MKLIKEKQHVLKTRSLGDRQWFDETVFEVEPNDVDRARDNHNGYLRPAYRFRLLDVGRHITVSEQGANYTCWWFTCKAKETEMESQDAPEYIVSTEDAPEYLVNTDDAAIKHALTILEGRLRKPGVGFTSPSSARDFLTLKLADMYNKIEDLERRIKKQEETISRLMANKQEEPVCRLLADMSNLATDYMDLRVKLGDMATTVASLVADKDALISHNKCLSQRENELQAQVDELQAQVDDQFEAIGRLSTGMENVAKSLTNLDGWLNSVEVVLSALRKSA